MSGPELCLLHELYTFSGDFRRHVVRWILKLSVD